MIFSVTVAVMYKTKPTPKTTTNTPTQAPNRQFQDGYFGKEFFDWT